MRPFTIAIMQPYFLPYAGYFQLFAASDLFVIYDCVQFPRRGRVHRNQLADIHGVKRWLTLPLEKAPRDVLIKDLQFLPNATQIMAQRLKSFSLVGNQETADILKKIRDMKGTPVDYIEHLLQSIVTYIGFSAKTIRSSALAIPQSFRGQDRILEIAKRVGAKRYVNSPGGRSLYNPNTFADAGIDLDFLPDYSGPQMSILARLLSEDQKLLAKDILASTGKLAGGLCTP